MNRDPNSASVRYRCLHPAQGLADQGINHRFFVSTVDAEACLNELSALIIVKRLDPSIVSLITQANMIGKLVYLDICDDVLSPSYRTKSPGLNQAVFRGIASFLAGIIVPTSAMAERMNVHCHTLYGLHVPIHVIPDVAESLSTLNDTIGFADKHSDFEKLATIKPKEARKSGSQKRILWFGNYGAPHSNFGLPSLLPVSSAIESASKRFDLELVVVSNNLTLYQQLIEPLPFNSVYLEWTPATVYEQLSIADVALLTNGDDGFCWIKSANRALQALKSPVPVIATPNPAIAELGEAVWTGDVLEGLMSLLDPISDRSRDQANAFGSMTQLYSRDTISKKWLDVLEKRHLRQLRSVSHHSHRILLVLTLNESEIECDAVLEYCKLHQYDLTVLVIQAQEFNLGLRDCLSRHGVSPIISNPEEIVTNNMFHLAGKTLVFLSSSSNSQKVAPSLTNSCEMLGIPIYNPADFSGVVINLEDKIAEPKLNTTSDNDSKPASNPGLFSDQPHATKRTAWVFVTHQDTKGWILDAICREIGSRQPEPWYVAYNPPSLPPAKHYFFSHYIMYMKHYKNDPKQFSGSNTIIWYTHPRDESPQEIDLMIKAFNAATKVVFSCDAYLKMWLDLGLNVDNGCVVLGGADPSLFQRHHRDEGCVGISSSFYERKNPDLMMEVIRKMPNRHFILLGRNWESYEKWAELVKLTNFQYETADYSEYPKFYEKFDVLLSTSTLEGGPIPLLEAMMANVVPVASQTGFAPDLIRQGDNGFIFPVNANSDRVCALIDKAFELETDVRRTVLRYSWESFAIRFFQIAEQANVR